MYDFFYVVISPLKGNWIMQLLSSKKDSLVNTKANDS